MLRTAAIERGATSYLNEKTEEGWKSVSFFEANEQSDLVASALMQAGFAKDDKFAILAEGRVNWIIAEFGILKAGGIAVPLSVKLLPDEVLFRLQHSESKGIFVTLQTYEKVLPVLDKISEPGFKLIFLDDNIDQALPNLQKSGLQSGQHYLSFGELTTIGFNNIVSNKPILDALNERIEEDDVVTISYTSGTTGNPKGIMLTHLNYYANSWDALNFFKLAPGNKTLIILPLDHSFAHVVAIFIAIICPFEIYFVDSRGGGMNTLKNIPINLKEVKPDFLLTVPALSGNFMNKISDAFDSKGGFIKWLFHRGMAAGMAINGDGYHKAGGLMKWINMPIYKLADALLFSKAREIFGGRLKFCIGGGALLDISQQRFFYALGAPIFQGYGLTEATPIISTNCLHTHKLGTSGRVLPGVTCTIRKPDGSLAPEGEKGEIVIKGLNVMKGYYKNPDESDKTVKDGWLYTGDMGYMEPDGFLMVVGREKALLISHDGEKYSPESIEEAIINCSPLVAQIMIYNDHSKYTTALITLDKNRLGRLIKEKHLKTPAELVKAIQKSMYEFKHHKDYAALFPDKWIPSTFRIVEEPFSEQNLMINSTLKMVRYKITETYRTLIDDMYGAEGTKVDCSYNLEVAERLLKELSAKK